VDPVLRILPLGGVGEVGRNLTVVEWDDARLVVDCGIGFPHGPRAVGEGAVEQLLPDVSYLAGLPITAVVLTHGHDDHIGALPHLIRSGAAIGQVVGLPFTIELVRAKLADGVPMPRAIVASPGRPLEAGPFRLEYVRVAHSIPDAAAVAIGTPAGTLVATGDYKLDTGTANPRRRFDRARFAALGADGVLAVLGDSTNAELAGRTPSEDTTFEPLVEVIRDQPGRVVVTSFASHIDRIDHALRAADETGRAVTVLGRSMRRNLEIAQRLGEVAPPRRPTLPPRDMDTVRPRRSLVLSTGSQAEQNAVLARATRGEHPQLRLSAADTVVFASRPVPGNEDEVDALIRGIRAAGARVVTYHDAPIHVSGHARADEIAEVLTLLAPRHVVPLHGERAMQEAQARIAVARCGLDRARVSLAENGDVLALVNGGFEVVARVPARVIEADADGWPLADW
jgi:ribonuclease J